MASEDTDQPAAGETDGGGATGRIAIVLRGARQLLWLQSLAAFLAVGASGYALFQLGPLAAERDALEAQIDATAPRRLEEAQALIKRLNVDNADLQKAVAQAEERLAAIDPAQDDPADEDQSGGDQGQDDDAAIDPRSPMEPGGRDSAHTRRIEDLTTERDEAARRAEDADRRAGEAEAAMLDAQAFSGVLTARVKALLAQLEEAQAEIARLKDEWESQDGAAVETLAAGAEQDALIAELRDQIGELDRESTALSANIDKSQAEIARLARDNESLRAQLSDARRDQGGFQKLQEENGSLWRDVERLNSDNRKLAEENQDLRQKLSDTNQHLRDLQAGLSVQTEFDQKICQLEAYAAQLHRDLQAAQANMRNANSQWSQAQRQYQTCQRQLADANIKLRSCPSSTLY